ncbi:KTSC domain-containing protein [Kitasatospora sp. GAS204B]|uniref:KTSC domain-containing protein n=1 Tax=unclassified Kitasatospora TaxID=2633591 RepID=UPI002475419C|nr:KTSC domain-containing protein [Kitasatospora sp. GAS204B]
MERVPVESSCLAAVGYDPADGALELEFTSGSVYRYLAVPEDVHRGLLAAESLGRYFHAWIRDRYEYRRIG